LDGKPIKHVSCFKYLGSIMSENGGVEEDITLSSPAGSGQSKQIQCHLEVGSEASAEGSVSQVPRIPIPGLRSRVW
jgi:hypothetical protein